MIKKILRWLTIAFLTLIIVLLINTLRTKPWPVRTADRPQLPLPDSAVRHLSQAVQIPTISHSDSTAIDTAAFTAFGSFITRAYPLVHQRLEKTLIDQFSYIFRWKGSDTSLPPIILMGHYDVVPVETASLDKWTMPPFSGAVMDTCVWGRGSVDDKAGVIGILEAVEALLRQGFVPKRTIYCCFGHTEEINGRSAGNTVRYLEKQKVRAEMVLDEGGEITEEETKEIPRPIAVIGVAEKGYASFGLSVQKEGGHSSRPGKETAIGILVEGLHRLKDKTPPARLIPPVKEFLFRVGSSSDDFLHRMASDNLWLFEGAAKKILSSQPEGSAMIHTTIVPTILESGVKDNVIPSDARAIINCRILNGETAKTVAEFIRATLQDDRIQVKPLSQYGSDPSPVTSIGSPAFRRVENAIYSNIPNVLPTPYLDIGATDSRYFRRISDGVVNFLPMTDSKGFHGIDERLPLRDLQRNINFIRTIIEDYNKDLQ